MAAAQNSPSSAAQIAVHWREEEYFYPAAKFSAQTNAADPSLLEQRGPLPGVLQGRRGPTLPGCLWHTTLDTSSPPFWKWFVGRRG
jgi:acetyl-CoA synthetase